jgi:hypothetical protein
VARVLINHYRNIAIEISRKDKWSIIVTGWTPTKRLRLLNSEVDREWHTFDYDLNRVANHMLNSTIGSIEDSAVRELNLIKGEKNHGE